MANKITVLLDLVTDKATSAAKGFKSSIADAEGAANKFRAGASSAFATVQANAGALALGAGSALAAFGAKSIATFQDTALAAGKFSDATGIAVEDASRLQEVASDLGVNTDSLAGSLSRFQKAVASNSSAVKDLGIEVKRTSDGQVDVNATFLDAIDKLGGVTDANQKALLASQLFGKGFADSAELILGNADDIKQRLDEVSDAQVISAEQVERARKFRDQMDELSDSLKQVEITVGDALVPVLGELADGLVLVENAAQDAFNELNKIPGVHIDVAGILSGQDLPGALQLFAKAVGEARDALNDGEDAASAAASTLSQDLVQAAIDAAQAEQDLNAETAIYRAQGDEYVRQLKAAGLAAKDAADGTTDFADAADALPEIMGAFADKVGVVDAALNDLRDTIDLGAELDDISQGFDDIAKAQDDLADGGDEAARKFRDQIRRQQGNLLDLLQTMKDIPTQKRTEIIAEIAAGDLDSLNKALDDIVGKDRFVHVGLIMPNIQNAFTGANVAFNPSGGNLTPTFSNPNPAAVNNSQTTIIYPVGSSPTTGFIDQRLFQNRNGTNPALMSLLLLFAYTPLAPSVPISELIQTAPLPGAGYAIDREAPSGEWRLALELADPQAGDSIVWHDVTQFYAGDSYQRGANEYLGKYAAAVAQVQLQTDNDDLAPWGQDTSALFGVNVELDGGLLMRLALFRVVASVTVEWTPVWTGRVETWGDASAARGQIRTHIVTVTDTIADLANVPTTIEANAVPVSTWLNENLNDAYWPFGVDYYGDDPADMPQDLTPVAAITRMDQAADPNGLVWRSRRDGRLIVYPAPWDTVNVARWSNPLLDVYPSGLVFSYSPDFTDIAYIDDDDQQPFGIPRTSLGVLNSFQVTTPSDLFLLDDPISSSRYGVRPFTATWTVNAIEQVVQDLLDARAYSSAQALPLRTADTQEGFWSAMALIDHLDPVTVIHATSPDGLVVTGTGVVRNVTERRIVLTDGAISWDSTVQIDIDATDTSPALLPVEDLALVSMNSPLLGGPSSAEFSWTNPVQPDITPTEVQLRVIGRSPIWFSEDYPGVGADGTTLGYLSAATTYKLQVRLVRRVNGVITAFSIPRSLIFTTPAVILPVPTPGDNPDDSNVDMSDLPFGDCEDDVSIELQEQTEVGGAWVTVDTFSGSEIELVDGVWHLHYDIPNSFFNDGSMYRYLGFCGADLIVTGLPFDPPDDWTDPCPDPAALSDPPFDDPSLLVYVPKVCTGFEDADPDYVFNGMLIIEAVSGIAGVPGDALAAVGTVVDGYALESLPDPSWSDAPAGIVAYGECPQIIGATGDKTITVRVNVVDAVDCVLFECGGMRITCSATSSGWRPGVTVYKTGVTIALAGATVLDEGTAYTITGSFELATGDIVLGIDGVEDNSVGSSDNEPTVTVLPIWRVGAPPESWITDCALFDSVIAVQPLPPETGLAHWWDASDLATITSSLGIVSQWDDKVGSMDLVGTAIHGAEGPSTGTRTHNGLNVLDFNGAQRVMNIPGGAIGNTGMVTSGYTLAAIYVQDTTGAFFNTSGVCMEKGTGSLEAGFVVVSTTVNWANHAAGQPDQAVAASGGVSNGTWRRDLVTAHSTGVTLYEQGASVGSRGATTLLGSSLAWTIGARYYDEASFLDGAIAEILVWDHPLDSTERAAFDAYAVAKWGT